MRAEVKELTALVFTPTGKDGALICDLLLRQQVDCLLCTTVAELAAGIASGAGLAIVAEEALTNTDIKAVAELIQNQPPWSDLPFLLLTSNGSEPSEASTRILSILGEKANITLLERPVRVPTLVSSIRTALRARRRQIELRDYLRDREEREERMLQSQKLESLGVLAGGVAHDFNNLLTGILGNASLALDNADGNIPIDGLLQDIIDAGQRAADLTRQLLAYSGKGQFQLQRLNVSKLVAQITKLVHAAIPRTVNVHLDLADNLPAVLADSAQMQQIIMNLVINAAESIDAERGGTVMVRTAIQYVEPGSIKAAIEAEDLKPGRYICLEVRDNGCGMTEEVMSRIFDPFFTTKFLGRGLGLAAVMGIIRGHHGALSVRSKVGAGSTFQVLLPAINEPVKAPEPRIRRKLNGTGLILVVDDEETVQKTARVALESVGYKVVVAGNGSEGVGMHRNMADQISLVLLDLAMPVMGGEEAFQKMKLARPDVKVILSSGYDETDVVSRFEGQGIDGFIQKPYTANALAQKVQDVLLKHSKK